MGLLTLGDFDGALEENIEGKESFIGTPESLCVYWNRTLKEEEDPPEGGWAANGLPSRRESVGVDSLTVYDRAEFTKLPNLLALAVITSPLAHAI